MAGRQWYYEFMQRHKSLTLRTPEQTSLNRVKAFCKENVDEFFRHLNDVLTETTFEPGFIWNMDETGFSIVPTKVGKIILMRGMRKLDQMIPQAAGVSTPPFYFFHERKCKLWSQRTHPLVRSASPMILHPPRIKHEDFTIHGAFHQKQQGIKRVASFASPG